MDIRLLNIDVQVGTPRRPLFSIPSFSLKTKEKVLINGPSGQGKTSLLHLISGLFLPDRGQIFLDETELTKLSEDQRSHFRRKNIGMIFQRLNLLAHLTAIENIQLAFNKGDTDEVAKDVLKAVGLAGREEDRISVLSLGEQQRVAIARLLAGKPLLVLADEPTSSLDEKNAENVMRLILEVCKDCTLIVVSHDQRIEKYFDRIINFGDLVQR